MECGPSFGGRQGVLAHLAVRKDANFDVRVAGGRREALRAVGKGSAKSRDSSRRSARSMARNTTQFHDSRVGDADNGADVEKRDNRKLNRGICRVAKVLSRCGRRHGNSRNGCH